MFSTVTFDGAPWSSDHRLKATDLDSEEWLKECIWKMCDSLRQACWGLPFLPYPSILTSLTSKSSLTCALSILSDRKHPLSQHLVAHYTHSPFHAQRFHAYIADLWFQLSSITFHFPVTSIAQNSPRSLMRLCTLLTLSVLLTWKGYLTVQVRFSE